MAKPVGRIIIWPKSTTTKANTDKQATARNRFIGSHSCESTGTTMTTRLSDTQLLKRPSASDTSISKPIAGAKAAAFTLPGLGKSITRCSKPARHLIFA
jgi:hypothetical protein